jgi:ADP-ribose pyrophosphatase
VCSSDLEFLDVLTATPTDLLGWCRDGTVTDAKTLACAVWMQNVLSGTWALEWQAADNSAP